MATFRYLVSDVQISIQFYTEILEFELLEQYGPAMAIVKKNDLMLWLAGPISSAAQPMPNGDKPSPGGWNRFVLQVKDLSALVSKMKSQNIQFRNDITQGPGGSQILIQDPSGNPIELFQPV